jgi:hypothetical protein
MLGARGVLVTALVWVAAPQAAAADADFAAGVARMAEADFTGALEAFDRAEAGAGLSRAELLQLLSLRATASHAMGEAELLERSLRQLASIDATFPFDDTTPPVVVERFRVVAATAQPIVLHPRVERVSDQIRILGEVTGDADGLVRSVRHLARLATDGPSGAWAETLAGPLELTAPGGATVEYYVELVGPGGAILAAVGSALAPERSVVSSLQEDAAATAAVTVAPTLALDPSPAPDEEPSDPTGLVLGIGLGAAVLGAVAVFFLARNDDTQLGEASFDFPGQP